MGRRREEREKDGGKEEGLENERRRRGFIL